MTSSRRSTSARWTGNSHSNSLLSLTQTNCVPVYHSQLYLLGEGFLTLNCSIAIIGNVLVGRVVVLKQFHEALIEGLAKPRVIL